MENKNQRGDKKILDYLLQYKFIAIPVVLIGAIGGGLTVYNIFLDSIIKTREAKLFDSSSQKEVLDTINIEPEEEVIIEPKPPVNDTPISSNKTSEENDKFIKQSTTKNILLNDEPVKGVKVWCENCLSSSENITNLSGKVDLDIEYELKYPSIQKLKICFAYKNKSDCLYIRHNKVSSTIPINFKFNQDE